MKAYQDSTTGVMWYVPEGVDMATVPKTLTSAIVERPTGHYDWLDGEWVENFTRKNKAHNDSITTEIIAIEAEHVRPLRELLIDPTNVYAKTKLLDINARISTLRSNLVVQNA